ncbi:MAG: hypothetical protein E7680_05405 [Ruminococcaceae bacterium]|nr:hypothetical protein [Oscillospiraceae bacterium]
MAVSKIRTNEEMQNPDLNYFIAFNIDPSETNVKKIEDVLNDKRKMFVRSVTTPISIRLMELKNDIDQVMLNDAFRSMNSDGNIIYIPRCCGRIQEATVTKKII